MSERSVDKLPQLGVNFNGARDFYREQRERTEWSVLFVAKAADFLAESCKPITRRDYYSETRTYITADELLLIDTPVWRTPQLPFESSCEKVKLELVGLIEYLPNDKPDRVDILFTGDYGAKRIFYSIHERNPKNWVGQPMDEKQRQEADNILRHFQTQHIVTQLKKQPS